MRLRQPGERRTGLRHLKQRVQGLLHSRPTARREADQWLAIRDAVVHRALEALSEAEDLAGGLPDYYVALRKRWIAALPPLAVVVRR